MSLTASSRSTANAPRMRLVFQQQRRLHQAAAEDGYGQQRAAGDPGEVRVAGEPVVAGRVSHDDRLTHPLGVSQHRHRHRGLSAAERSGREIASWGGQ